MSDAWIAVLLAGAGTYAMRASFLAFAHRMTEVPPWLRRLLRQIPPAALASLVVPALLRPQGHVDLFQGRLWAGALAAFVAWRTRNIAITLIVGMGVLIIIDQI
ncbi:MAG: AzlD domain-containing protein [Actinomycetota bacterium]|nr:AzlD domain-containing protein [Actinomycetota bacterium]